MFKKWNAAAWGVLAAAIALDPSAALAQTSASQTIGDLFASLGNDVWKPFIYLIVSAAYLVGFYLLATGLVKLRDAGGREGGGMDGAARLAGAAFLICLPEVMGSGLMSFFGQAVGWRADQASAGGTDLCVSTVGGGSASPLTCVAKNFATNVVPVGVKVLFGLFYLAGMAMVAHAIYTAATASSSGQRGLPKGWSGRLVIGILVANVPQFMLAVATTLGIGGATINGNGLNASSSLLSYSGTSVGLLSTYADLVKYVFTILVLFGVIAVWKGMMMLRAHAEGGQQGTMGSGLTHVIGGVLLANSKFTVCVVMNTLFGLSSGAQMGFC